MVRLCSSSSSLCTCKETKSSLSAVQQRMARTVKNLTCVSATTSASDGATGGTATARTITTGKGSLTVAAAYIRRRVGSRRAVVLCCSGIGGRCAIGGSLAAVGSCSVCLSGSTGLCCWRCGAGIARRRCRTVGRRWGSLLKR